ncbi:MAG TPA: hypothetical protein VM032_15145 [Vicinamibacterales bacterium]|nr:hypothetical protein [Vicinamibacterales bacterium]
MRCVYLPDECRGVRIALSGDVATMAGDPMNLVEYLILTAAIPDGRHGR